jgi:hypothetical protein
LEKDFDGSAETGLIVLHFEMMGPHQIEVLTSLVLLAGGGFGEYTAPLGSLQKA